MNTLALYLYAAMIFWTPLKDHLFAEGAPITEARYQQIAVETADTLLDPAEEPLFDGANGRAESALFMLSIASFESGGFASDVQFCKKGGDGNHAWGLFQSHAGKDQACGGIRAALHQALAQVRESFAACRKLPAAERLSGYAAGNCRDGKAESRRRALRAREWWAAHPYNQ